MKWFSIIWSESNAYKNKKQNTNPINPLTSTKEKPINAHLIKELLMEGLRDIPNTKKPNITPTPIPTPTKEKRGKLAAR